VIHTVHVQYQSGGNNTVVVRGSLLVYKNGDNIFTEKNQQAGVLYVHVHLYNLFTRVNSKRIIC